MGGPLTAEHKANLSAAMRGRQQSPEHVQRRTASIAANRATWTPEWRAEVARRNSAGHIGHTPWNKGNDWRASLKPEEVRALAATRARARRVRNPGRRVHERVSSMVRQALREQKSGRSWESLVGYTRTDLMQRLESLFTDGMSWDSLGDWHIDHIVPRAAFRFATADDPGFLACWALGNLQPLWASDNLAKRDRVPLPAERT